MRKANPTARPKSSKGRIRPTPPQEPKNNPQRTTNLRRGSYGNPVKTRSVFQKSKEPVHPQELASSSRNTTDTDSITERILNSSPVPRRPPSSLSRFSILPEINPNQNDNESVNEIDLLTSEAQQMILDSTMQPTVNLTRFDDVSPSHKATSKNNVYRSPDKRTLNTMLNNNASPVRKKTKYSRLNMKNNTTILSNNNKVSKSQPSISKQNDKEKEPNLLIALKLPNGTRIEQRFSPNITITELMEFAQTHSDENMHNCDIYSMQKLPKILIKNWKQSLKHLQIPDRTVLYIEERD